MACARCGHEKPWPTSFVDLTFPQATNDVITAFPFTGACCLTCWLRVNPDKLEALRVAIAEVERG